MRLVTFRTQDGSRAGLVRDALVFPLPWPDVGAAIPAGFPAILAAADTVAPLPLADLTLLAPILRPGKIIAVGLNYRDHCEEQHLPPPERPTLFAKFTTAITHPEAPIRWDPAVTQQVDYEAELAVVIGRTARRVSAAAAYDYVFGYTCLNDITARDLQKADGQWVRSKSLDTFCPLGPVVVTADELPDPHGLQIQTWVNGELRQNSNTDQLIHKVPALIAFCAAAFTLEPGDIITTGTPGGVGLYRQPPSFLQPGDQVEIAIERIGHLRNPIGPYLT
jgi:2-keto-4-pentenoate hydratase/2-oxohepta-3-ene-1,7-dioic acid hydratase in catechol pathway